MILDRRTLIKLGSAMGIAAPVFLRSPRNSLAQTVNPNFGVITATRRPFGRAIINAIAVHKSPSAKSVRVRLLHINEVVEIKGQTIGDGPTAYNPIWYQTPDGFVHSANVQPSDNKLNAPLAEIDQAGVWVEVTVPVAEVHPQPDSQSKVVSKLFFGMLFRAVSRHTDAAVAAAAANQVWYRLLEGNGAGVGYVRAEQLRPLTADDFAPISPDIPLEKKTLEVNIKTQIATAYEDGQAVFTARVATGGSYRTPQGVRSFATTRGKHRIFMKIPGQRMRGGTPGYDFYNLPGVSWVSYFTGSGIAFHGAYWHNDFGKPRSHGCVNMLPEDAQWVFRWTTPIAPHTTNQFLRVTKRDEGSLVKVI
jgi:lipoprotein-anchoring transpeptidase ErfK/SrfK